MHLPKVTKVAAIKEDLITVAAVIATATCGLAYSVGSFLGFIASIYMEVDCIMVVVLAACFQDLAQTDDGDDEVSADLTA